MQFVLEEPLPPGFSKRFKKTPFKIPALPVPRCAVLSRSLNLSVLRFPCW